MTDDEDTVLGRLDYLSAQVAIYRHMLAALLKDSPRATEVEQDARALVGQWEKDLPSESVLVMAGKEALTFFFLPDS
ncbi:hypothetical protein [Rhizobium sp. A37_96]